MNTRRKSQRRRCQSDPSLPASLPEELTADILSRLTVKDLMQMKCVSKSWKTLISDPNFIKMHLNRSARNPNLSSVVSTKNGDYSLVHFPASHLLENRMIRVVSKDRLNIEEDFFQVIGSCNGLICLHGYSYHEITGYKKVWFRLWNPATRTISHKLGCNGYRYKWSNTKFGFGYDDSAEIYKVVAVCRGFAPRKNTKERITKVRVLNLSDNVWRTIQTFPVQINDVEDGVHLNCTVNWLAYSNDNLVRKIVIISLDLATETYTQILPPTSSEHVIIWGNICVLMDSLCFYDNFKGTDLVIWQLTEFEGEKSWTQFLKFSHRNFPMNYDLVGTSFSKLTPLYISKNGNTLVLKSNIKDGEIVYNRITNKGKKIRINKAICWFSIKGYVESLVSTS
jgi:F-box interacting protein